MHLFRHVAIVDKLEFVIHEYVGVQLVYEIVHFKSAGII